MVEAALVVLTVMFWFRLIMLLPLRATVKLVTAKLLLQSIHPT